MFVRQHVPKDDPGQVREIFLEEIATGTGDSCFFPIGRLIVLRYDQDVAVRIGLQNTAAGLQSADPGKLQVHEHPVGVQPAEQRHRCFSLATLHDPLDWRFQPGKHFAHQLAETGVVINQKDCHRSDLFHACEVTDIPIAGQ